MFAVLCNRDLFPEARFSEKVARDYFWQLICGVEYIHSKGVAHLDLSLENVMLDSADVIRIIDFGLSRKIPLDPDTGKHLLFDRLAMLPTNKVFYIAPEIYNKYPFDSEKCDMWSCGSMLFIMLAGSPAYNFPNIEMDKRFKLVADGKLTDLMDAWKLTSIISPEAIGERVNYRK